MSLTPSQTLAACTTNKSVAVIASAGSGKTRVLIEHLRHLITNEKIPPYRLLAFTFTEKAAGEIKQRILNEKILPLEEESTLPIGTIHGFCAKILKRYGSVLGLDPNFTINNETQTSLDQEFETGQFILNNLQNQDKVFTSFYKHFGFLRLHRIFLKLIEEPWLLTYQNILSSFDKTQWIKFILRQAQDVPYPDMVSLSNHDVGGEKLIPLAQTLFTDLLTQRIKKAALNFFDLEYLTLLLLDSHPEIKNKLGQRYLHILVDEFQDTNPFQAALINHLYQPKTNYLFIVGDPKQSIYRFRQADVTIFKNVFDQIQKENGNIVYLKQTFRIPQQLTQTFNQIFLPLFTETPQNLFEPLTSEKISSTEKLQILVHPDNTLTMDQLRKNEATWIANYLASQNLSPEELDNTALLFRSGSFMNMYKKALEKAGIPTQITRTEDLLKTEPVRDLLHILAYLAGETKLVTQVGILRSIFFNLSENFIEQWTKNKPDDLLTSFTPDLFLSEVDQKKWPLLTELFKRWETYKNILPPYLLFKMILGDLKTWTPSHVPDILLEQWLMLLEELGEKSSLTLRELYQDFKSLVDSDNEVKTFEVIHHAGSVHLMTIHAAKGLEFKRVFLPQLYATTTSNTYDYLYDPIKGFALKTSDPTQINGLQIELKESPLFEELKEKELFEAREETKRLLYVAMTRTEEELFLFLKQPKKEKIDILKTSNWNDWLWELLAEEREKAVVLKSEIETSWNSLAHKIQDRLQTTEQLSVAGRQSPVIRPMVGRPEPGDQKPTFTVSTIETFLRCQKEYQLKHLEGIYPVTGDRPLATGDSLTWGLLVHEVLQFLDTRDYSNAKTVIDQALINQHLEDSDQKITQKLTDLINSLQNNQEITSYLSSTESLLTEIPFLVDDENFYIKGTLDRLFKHQGEWIILDYKTDRIANEPELIQREKAYWGQLACYALAASQILGVKELKTALLFTDGPYLRIQEWNSDKLNHAKITINKTVNIMTQKQKTSFEYPLDKKICFHCPYYELNYCGVKNS